MPVSSQLRRHSARRRRSPVHDFCATPPNNETSVEELEELGRRGHEACKGILSILMKCNIDGSSPQPKILPVDDEMNCRKTRPRRFPIIEHHHIHSAAWATTATTAENGAFATHCLRKHGRADALRAPVDLRHDTTLRVC